MTTELEAAPSPSVDAAEQARAFEALARAHLPALESYALRICRDGAEARDLVQDTLERGLRSFHRLAPESNPRAWLFTIVHNLFIDRCRKRRREAQELLEEQELAAPAPEEPPPWTAITPEQLRRAVDGLDEEFRVVYRLHALEGRSYAEISATLGVPMNTVGSRLARARAKLRVILEAALGGGEL